MADLLVGLDADTDVRLEVQSGDTWLVLAPEEVALTVTMGPWSQMTVATSNEDTVAVFQLAYAAEVPIALRIYLGRIGEQREYLIVSLVEGMGRWTAELEEYVYTQPNPADPG